MIVECSDYDFKEDLETKKPRSWLKSVSAFANGIGESLFFGVDDDGNPKDLTDIAAKSDKISELIKMRIDPIPLFF
ncbi:MAG: ATP-binding protein [Bacilli bacterium]|nr:ATP-binding protein [Bacilli bacterium]